MELLEFMNRVGNWEEVLAAAPYNLEIKSDGPYTIMSYRMFESDMALPLVQEARGSIFTRNEDGMWVCVCRAMDKFFNWGEPCAATIDWKSAKVMEKVDGSLIKVWHHNGKWHVSTNNTINAYQNEIVEGITFGSLFDRLRHFNLEDLDTHYCYWFELVSKWNPLVVQYKDEALYYLGCRNMGTMKEEGGIPEPLCCQPHPTYYNFHSLQECISTAALLDRDHEGFVVVDSGWNRIKVKGSEYLRLAKLRGNDLPTTKYLIELWRNKSLDDYYAAFPQYRIQVDEFHSKIVQLSSNLNVCNAIVAAAPTKKILAEWLQKANSLFYVRAYCFGYFDGKWKNGMEFVNKMRESTIENMLKQA